MRDPFGPPESPPLFGLGVAMIGFGGGLFAHGTMTASMMLAEPEDRGLALGAWGAAQATAAGLAIAVSGAVNDLGSCLTMRGVLGDTLVNPATGYTSVYGIEVILLFAALIAVGPLVRPRDGERSATTAKFSVSIAARLNSGGLR